MTPEQKALARLRAIVVGREMASILPSTAKAALDLIDQFHEDYKLMLTAAMYGTPPGGWSDPDRINRFLAEVADAERRHRDFDEFNGS